MKFGVGGGDWDILLMVAVVVTVPSHVPGCVAGEFYKRYDCVQLWYNHMIY